MNFEWRDNGKPYIQRRFGKRAKIFSHVSCYIGDRFFNICLNILEEEGPLMEGQPTLRNCKKY